MSRYESLRAELGRLRLRRGIAVIVPTASIALLLALSDGDNGKLAAVGCVVMLPLLLDHACPLFFPTYRDWRSRSSQIVLEIADLKQRIELVFTKYRARQKGEQFKRTYELVGRSVRDLEEALSVGMFRERREVFVTAFMRGEVAVRVTASIGSPFRCSAADNPARWREHVVKLRCDEVRQYHNHPDHNGSTQPSALDIRTSGSLKRVLGAHGPKLRSLIICWNDAREWKVVEYDEAGRHALHFEFDAAVCSLPVRAEGARITP